MSLLVACAASDKPAVVVDRPCPVNDAGVAEASSDAGEGVFDASALEASASVDASDAAAVDVALVNAAHALALKPFTLARSPSAAVVAYKALRTSANKLPPEVIVRIVRQNFGRYRLCFENVRRERSTIRTAEVTTFFAIKGSGEVAFAETEPVDSVDPLAKCIQAGIGYLSFPQPDPPLIAVELTLAFDANAIPPRRVTNL